MLTAELKKYLIRPALTQVNLWSESSEILIAGTIAIESGGKHLKQVGGPALGLCQIEPSTHKDIQKYLNKPSNESLRKLVLDACGLVEFPFDDALVWNLRYAIIIARLIYYRNKAPLPWPTDAIGMANYHKFVYNTASGKADPKKTVEIFRRIINDDEGG